MHVCMYKLNDFNISCTSDEKDLSFKLIGFRAFSIYKQSRCLVIFTNKIK